MRAREDAAAAGAELVRVPLARHGPGWGCICPEYYLGTSTVSASDNTTWIAPTFAATAPPLAPDTVVIAEGYFTGKRTPFTSSGPEEFDKATLHELHVLRHRPPGKDPEGDDGPTAETRPQVLLGGKDAHHEGAPPADGKTFLLIAASIPMTDSTKATAAAERKRAELLAKGWSTAEVLDSRLAPGLFCCHLVVVAERHTTEREAVAAATAAKTKRVTLLVRRGW